MDKRQRYLSQVWQPYPTVPGPDWSAGELISLEDLSGTVELKVLSQGRISALSAHGSRVTTIGGDESTGKYGIGIFRPGDKIAFREGQGHLELALLSPCLKEWCPPRLNPELARRWQDFLRLVRAHFTSQDFVEISTPSLVVCPGTEPSLEPLSVTVRTSSGRVERFLPTSPELHLKKLLAQGWSRLFEIRSCFRDGEHSSHHQIEFTMMEYYRAFEPLDAIIRDLEELMSRLRAEGLVLVPAQPSQRFTVANLFQQLFEFALRPGTPAAELAELCDRHGLQRGTDDSWNDLFHRLWLCKIEPWLATQESAVFVRDFPPSQAALARIGSEGWAERVELFWRGLEIANGFHELNDPTEQRSRFHRDLAEKERLGRQSVPIDEDFMNALNSGMPPASGVAVGLERLFMAAQGIGEIQSLKAFPEA